MQVQFIPYFKRPWWKRIERAYENPRLSKT